MPGNPLLAESLYLTEYIERMRTGTLDMIRRCVEAGPAEFEFAITDGFVTTIRRAAVPGQVIGQAMWQVAGSVSRWPESEECMVRPRAKLGAKRAKLKAKLGAKGEQSGVQAGVHVGVQAELEAREAGMLRARVRKDATSKELHGPGRPSTPDRRRRGMGGIESERNAFPASIEQHAPGERRSGGGASAR